MVTTTNPSTEQPSRSRKVRALLAGGLVLGLGGAVTLAAWNDSEYASSTVTASTFGIEGSANGEPFTEHSTVDAAAELVFDPALPELSPGQSGFLQFSVRTTADSTADGSVSLQTPQTSTTSPELEAALLYGVRVQPAGSSCAPDLFEDSAAAVIVPNGTPVTADVPENSQPLDPAGANTVDYCVRISMDDATDNAAQGQTVTLTWQFLAQSA